MTVNNQSGYTALALAAKIGDVKIMKELLKAGADPNSVNNAHQSVVFVAWWWNQLEALKLICKPKYDIKYMLEICLEKD